MFRCANRGPGAQLGAPVEPELGLMGGALEGTESKRAELGDTLYIEIIS